jgi:hypothetical protein
MNCIYIQNVILNLPKIALIKLYIIKNKKTTKCEGRGIHSHHHRQQFDPYKKLSFHQHSYLVRKIKNSIRLINWLNEC